MTKRQTLVPCLACGGDFARNVEPDKMDLDRTDKVELCKHCTRGAMTEVQLGAWRELRASRPSIL